MKKFWTASSTQKDSKHNLDTSWMAQKTKNNSSMIWIIDLGASQDITPDESIFTNKQSIMTSVSVASGGKQYA